MTVIALLARAMVRGILAFELRRTIFLRFLGQGGLPVNVPERSCGLRNIGCACSSNCAKRRRLIGLLHFVVTSNLICARHYLSAPSLAQRFRFTRRDFVGMPRIARWIPNSSCPGEVRQLFPKGQVNGLIRPATAAPLADASAARAWRVCGPGTLVGWSVFCFRLIGVVHVSFVIFWGPPEPANYPGASAR